MSHVTPGVGIGRPLPEKWSEHGGKVVYQKKIRIPEVGRIDDGWPNKRKPRALLQESVSFMDLSTGYILYTDENPVPRMKLDSFLCLHICLMSPQVL